MLRWRVENAANRRETRNTPVALERRGSPAMNEHCLRVVA
jgi:hypothetical protein